MQTTLSDIIEQIDLTCHMPKCSNVARFNLPSADPTDWRPSITIVLPIAKAYALEFLRTSSIPEVYQLAKSRRGEDEELFETAYGQMRQVEDVSVYCQALRGVKLLARDVAARNLYEAAKDVLGGMTIGGRICAIDEKAAYWEAIEARAADHYAAFNWSAILAIGAEDNIGLLEFRLVRIVRQASMERL
jgi:hypothetical protein